MAVSNAQYNKLASQGKVYGPVNPSSQSFNADQQRRASQAVLGASTGPGGGSPTTTQTQVAAPSGSNGGGDVNTSDISDAYAPALQAIAEAENALRGNASAQEESVGRNYQSSLDQTNTESAQLKTETSQRQDQFNKQLRSAYENAVRAYNALNQQKIAKFGGGSSAGGAVGELAQQEYFKQQGNINDQQSQGDLQFSGEFSKIGSYIGKKLTDLDNWKKDTMSQIQQNLSSALAEISARRGDVESNKTRDKLALLQSARDRVAAVQDANRSFMQQLAVASLSQAQQISGRAFTPTEIQATLQQWGIPLNGVSGVTGQTPTPTGRPNDQYDEFGNLINA